MKTNAVKIQRTTKVLIVENDSTCRFFLEEILASSRYNKFKVESTDSLKEALKVLKKDRFDAVLLDLNLPDSTGITTATKISKKYPEVALVVVTGAYDEIMGINAVAEGAQDYLIKGEYENKMLLRSVQYAVERKKLDIDRVQAMAKLKRLLEETVGALSLSLERRDPYTAGHQQRVSKIACEIAREMKVKCTQLDGIRMAGLLHDIGKIHIPSIILTKPGKLSETEWKLIKTHPQVGYEILKEIEFPFPVAQAVLEHHEHMDGTGYPRGIKKNSILFEAKILCVADVVDAMSSHRPYRSALGVDAAMEEIEKNKGKIYDIGVSEACLTIFKEKEFRIEA